MNVNGLQQSQHDKVLSPIPISLEMIPQLEYIVMKLATEASLIGILPLTVDNLESDVLQRRKQTMKK